MTMQLFREHEIPVPLKTQGWIINSLHSIRYEPQNGEWHYRYFKGSRDSTKMFDLLSKLSAAIQTRQQFEEHGASPPDTPVLDCEEEQDTIGAVVSALPGIQNHQAAVAILCKIIAPTIVVTGAGKRESAHKGTHGNNTGHNAVHRGVGRIGGRNALEPFLLEIGEGAHLALLDVEGALHTAADLCEVDLILCNRHHGQRHHGNRFALLVDPLHDFLAVLGGFLGALPGQRVFGTVSGAALLDNAFGDCGNERTIVNGGNPHRNNGAGDVGDLGKPPHIHLLRIADGAVHLK